MIGDSVADQTSGISDWSSYLLPGFMLLLALSAAVTVGLTWWFRREDGKVREQLRRLRARDFVEPLAESEAQPDADERQQERPKEPQP
jgi:hypothetical protein